MLSSIELFAIRCFVVIQCSLHSAEVGQDNCICTCTSCLHVFLCRVLRVSRPHLRSHDGQSLTDSELCPSFPFIHPKSSVVIGTPTDVNWAVLKRVVRVSSRDSDTYTPARELSDAMRALLYNLDNTITLRTKPDQRP
jgi:hypothetical protein